MNKYFVRRETAKSKTIAFGVLDNVGGMESEHGRFLITSEQSEQDAKTLADKFCSDLNLGIVKP